MKKGRWCPEVDHYHVYEDLIHPPRSVVSGTKPNIFRSFRPFTRGLGVSGIPKHLSVKSRETLVGDDVGAEKTGASRVPKRGPPASPGLRERGCVRGLECVESLGKGFDII